MDNVSRQVVNGILLLDKGIGLSSNQALSRVKKIFRAKKAGHTGSLDPLANGMLPICFGEATKFSQFLLEADKQYVVEAQLGKRTTTGDREGEIISDRPVPTLSLEALETVLDTFRGRISQIPSMYSALKYQGKPLYSYARKGIVIPRESREVTIRQLTVNGFNQDQLRLTITCSKGTYIRSLIDDLGEQLGCGAFVAALRRSYVEPFQDYTMLTLEELDELAVKDDLLNKHLLPMESALTSWPEVILPEAIAFYIRQGQPVLIPKAPTQGLVRLLTASGNFLGIGHVLSDGRIAPKRLLATGS